MPDNDEIADRMYGEGWEKRMKDERTTDVFLTIRDITLLRCGLLCRMDNLKDRPECQESYKQSKVLLEILWNARKQLEEVGSEG